MGESWFRGPGLGSEGCAGGFGGLAGVEDAGVEGTVVTAWAEGVVSAFSELAFCCSCIDPVLGKLLPGVSVVCGGLIGDTGLLVDRASAEAFSPAFEDSVVISACEEFWP